jgi:hypothetical protein
MTPLLDDPERSWKKAAFSQFPRSQIINGKRVRIMGYSMRTDQFRYTEWVNIESKEVLAIELYDHKIDSMESVN